MGYEYIKKELERTKGMHFNHEAQEHSLHYKCNVPSATQIIEKTTKKEY